MITAIVLIGTERARAHDVADALLGIEGVTEVYSVAGEYDLVAMVRVRRYEQMADVVPQKIGAVPGIARTHTMMAFEHYSRHDLERMWGLGMEGGV